MHLSDLDKIKHILTRYKLAYQKIGETDIEIGGGQNIQYLRKYYFYLPIVIGGLIVILGFLIDFVLFKFAGIPFLLYAIYGFDQVKKAYKENVNTTKISQGELKFPTNKCLITFKKGDIKDIELTIEKTDNEFYSGHFRIIDSKNIGYVVFIFVDDEPQILRGNMEDLKAFILFKLNQ